jgi:hypothetical protein
MDREKAHIFEFEKHGPKRIAFGQKRTLWCGHPALRGQDACTTKARMLAKTELKNTNSGPLLWLRQ